jgi:uncharacterized membrane protein
MLRESGASSTPRPIGSTTEVSGILDHPLSRMMTTIFESLGMPPYFFFFGLAFGSGPSACGSKPI